MYAYYCNTLPLPSSSYSAFAATRPQVIANMCKATVVRVDHRTSV